MRSYNEFKEIIELWQEGYNKLQISKKLGIPRATVRDCLKRYSTVEELDATMSQQNRVEPDLARKILTLWEAGNTKVDIAKSLGITRYVVNNNIEEYRSLSQLEAIEKGEAQPNSTRSYRSRKRKYTDDELREAVANSVSIAATLRALGLRPAGGNYELVNQRIKELGIDTSHFRGMGWLKGQKNHYSKKRAMEDILVKDSTYANSNKLKKRLLDEGYFEHRCVSCELETWLQQPIPLELDHINGDRRDNRLENLRLLCPNCHALTTTYRGKNINLPTAESNG